MGRKKLERTSVESLFSTVSSMLVPEHVLAYFEIWGAREHKDRWVIEMLEKEGFIPKDLSGCDDVVFDGYCNPMEALTHFAGLDIQHVAYLAAIQYLTMAINPYQFIKNVKNEFF